MLPRIGFIQPNLRNIVAVNDKSFVCFLLNMRLSFLFLWSRILAARPPMTAVQDNWKFAAHPSLGGRVTRWRNHMALHTLHAASMYERRGPYLLVSETTGARGRSRFYFNAEACWTVGQFPSTRSPQHPWQIPWFPHYTFPMHYWSWTLYGPTYSASRSLGSIGLRVHSVWASERQLKGRASEKQSDV